MKLGNPRVALPLMLLGVATFLSCSRPTVRLEEGPREYVDTDYETVLRHWTRTMQLIKVSELDNVLTVSATFESWDFRWAYVVRYAEDYRLTIDQRLAVLERSLAETRENHHFYVALYAQKYEMERFDRAGSGLDCPADRRRG